MKDLLSKQYYCYKIYTLVMKSNSYPPFYRQPPFMDKIVIAVVFAIVSKPHDGKNLPSTFSQPI